MNQFIADLLRGFLQKLNFSFSPSFSLGIRARIKAWNRFNGFRKIPVFLHKPLKRLSTFRVAHNPKLKLGENEKLSFARVSLACRYLTAN